MLLFGLAGICLDFARSTADVPPEIAHNGDVDGLGSWRSFVKSTEGRWATILSALCMLRLYLSTRGGIQVDEAYYWNWSRHLAWGYYDHPPMIAWLIALSRAVLDALAPDALEVQAPAVFAQIGLRWLPMVIGAVLAPLLLMRTIERLQRAPLSAWQRAVVLTAPVFVFGPQMVTPDIPFFFFWTLSLWLCVRLREHDLPEKLRHRLAWGLGLSLGATGLSKYAAILTLPLVLGAGLGWRTLWRVGAGGLLTISPHLFWQFTAPGAADSGIFFQFRNAWRGNVDVRWARLGDLWASQFLLWTPLVLVGAAVAALRARAVGSARWLGTWAFLPLLFFSYSSLRRPAEGNWPWVGVLGGLVLVVYAASARRRWLKALFYNHVLISVIALLLIVDAAWLAPLVEPWSPKAAHMLRRPSRLHEFQGWPELHSEIFAATESDHLEIHVASYQYLSELLFADAVAPAEKRMGSRLRIWTAGSRGSQFSKLPQYLPSAIPGTYAHWIIDVAEPSEPARCPLQGVVRKAPRGVPFRVMRCG